MKLQLVAGTHGPFARVLDPLIEQEHPTYGSVEVILVNPAIPKDGWVPWVPPEDYARFEHLIPVEGVV